MMSLKQWELVYKILSVVVCVSIDEGNNLNNRTGHCDCVSLKCFVM